MLTAHHGSCFIITEPMAASKDYDEEPVIYCAKCYSLRIRHEDAADTDVCMDCGCTETATADIGTWERLYEHRYGKRLVDRSNDPRESVYFKMPLQKLKAVFCSKPDCMSIIHQLYPHFPKGLSTADSIIMLFDRLCSDNRLDDLRLILYKQSRKKII